MNWYGQWDDNDEFGNYYDGDDDYDDVVGCWLGTWKVIERHPDESRESW